MKLLRLLLLLELILNVAVVESRTIGSQLNEMGLHAMNSNIKESSAATSEKVIGDLEEPFLEKRKGGHSSGGHSSGGHSSSGRSSSSSGKKGGYGSSSGRRPSGSYGGAAIGAGAGAGVAAAHHHSSLHSNSSGVHSNAYRLSLSNLYPKVLAVGCVSILFV